MRPRLLVIAGPSKDSTIPLPDGEATLGRDPTNAVAVADASVSRKHCMLRQEEDGRFQIKDLDSRNGTLVNGLAVKEQWLRHGDEIATGDSVFLFLLEDDDQALPASRVEFDDSHPAAETKVIHPKEVIYLQPDRLLRELPASSQVARNLNALLKISRVVHAIRGLEELQAQLLDLIFEVVPAGRGSDSSGRGSRAGIQLSVCADAAGWTAATGAYKPHDCAPGDEGERRDTGNGCAIQWKTARGRKPGCL